MRMEFHNLLFAAVFHEDGEIRRDALIKAIEIAEQQRLIEELLSIATSNNVITDPIIADMFGIDKKIIDRVRRECTLKCIELCSQDSNADALQQIIENPNTEKELRGVAIEAFRRVLSDIIKKHSQNDSWLSVLRLLRKYEKHLNEEDKKEFRGLLLKIAESINKKIDEKVSNGINFE